MATLLLQAAGAAVGSLFGPLGTIIGRAVGGLAGYTVDQALFGTHTQGARLSDLAPQTSTEGTPIPRLYGRARISGQVIWATNYEEVSNSGGKGGLIGGGSTTYSYYANFAIGLCEGPIAAIGRVWADGQPFDLSSVTARIYTGTAAQGTDSLIEAKQGDTPAYRDTAIIVFERLPIADFGNRIPQLSFEILKPVAGVETDIRAVTLIPGATEFGYSPTVVKETATPGRQDAGEPTHRRLDERLAGGARRPAGDLSEPRSGRAGGGVVRQRLARCELHADAGGGRSYDEEFADMGRGGPDPHDRAAGESVRR